MVENYNEVLYNNEIIETKRLILRKFKVCDAKDLFEYGSDPAVLEYMVWPGFKSIEEARAGIYNNYLSKPGIYAIELKENAKCIGDIDLRITPEHEKVSVGYALNREYWGRGLMSEALKAVLELCFDKLEVNRVEAGHFAGNEASGRVMEKCGMVKEGIARQEFKVRGVFIDDVKYAVTRGEWVERKADWEN